MPTAHAHNVGRHPDPRGFQPIRVLDIELARPLSRIQAIDTQTGRCYRQARALVRLHATPLGVVELALGDDGLDAAGYAAAIWQGLHPEINMHLVQDGLAPVCGLPVGGIPAISPVACIAARSLVLAAAPAITVIVCTRDRTEQLAHCLGALVALEYPCYEIVVVDNAPRTPATEELVVGQYGHLGRVHYVREERPGLSWARNCGLRHATSEIVAFIDDDACADPHWLAEIARGFASGADVACVTGLTLPAELETPAQALFEQFGGFNKYRGFDQLRFNTTSHRPDDPFFPYLAAKFGAGVNMAFRRSALLAVGAFDPALGVGTPAYGAEDIDAFFRLIVHGHTLAYEPAALVRHYHRRDYAALRHQLHGSGIAFTAFLCRCVAHHPQSLLQLLLQLPRVPGHLLSGKSPRNALKRADYPRELARTELLGMVQGPVAYLRSLRRTRHIVRQHGWPEVEAP